MSILEKIDECKYRLPKTYKPGMRVDGIIYANSKLLENIVNDKALEQVANVAFLPGIVKHSLAMPDIHWGYGFPIGGVAATDPDNGGVISPGGVGYDINCGVRLLRTNLKHSDIKDRISKIADSLFNHVPCGVGSSGQIKLSLSQEKRLLIEGAQWIVKRGMGVENDLDCCEDNGAIAGAEPDAVSERALERGKKQSGTLGSGNHFIEVQRVEDIYDPDLAQTLGVYQNQIMVMIHSGSRGLGYQVCDDYIKVMVRCLAKYKIEVPDRQLCCAPLNSPEANEYLAAMRCAANYAWANRQALTHLTREAFSRIFSKKWESLGMSLVYDVAHNIAKIENYNIDGKQKSLCVHRKGATRAFDGQPVIIPGDMGTASYLLVGTKKAQEETFGTVCHGAGRVASRTHALKTIDFNKLMSELNSKKIEIRAANKRSIVEEAPQVYKDVDSVVDVVTEAGLAKKVCRLKPLCVIKG